MQLTFSKALKLTLDELLAVLSYFTVEWAYNLIGRLVARRRCYVHQCTCTPDIENHTYHPHYCFFWQREYWRKFQPECPYCQGKDGLSKIIRSYDGLSGVLYSLPGYRKHDFNSRPWVQYLLADPAEQQRLRMLAHDLRMLAREL